MFIAMEGSSPTIFGENNYKYYVWQAYLNTKESKKIYIEGPAAISISTSPVNIRKMSDFAVSYINRFDEPVYLIGWSRGAAACIQVAHNLARTNKKIEAMFLFDAVDQDTSTDSNLNFIPKSVKNVYHAIATKKDWMDRQIFPTCGKTADPSVNFVVKKFNATHGTIAGKGTGDDGSKDWMWSKMRLYNLI
ncbi:MAG TPA: hypothetical protein VNK26_02525 [Pyrinomonadaceae bacterium]|jgi:pimeloyl-ACP methyl ester carboxylesterase|nr:hypothetical protein [Pyrinomonadaceae bacterium]